MYHASVLCLAHDNMLFGFSCTTTLVPGGAIGVALKSKFPNNAAYAERDGFRLDDLNKLMGIIHCGRSQSHSLGGDFGSQVYNPAIIWFLYACMARSAALRRLICGGISWYSTWASLEKKSCLWNICCRECVYLVLHRGL